MMKAPAAEAPLDRGVFDLGDNRVLVTDLRVLDDSGDHAVLIEHPDPGQVEAAARQSGRWRETVGAFQLAVPVEVKADMLGHHVRLLSMLRWRAGRLRPNDRWYSTFRRYAELIAGKVQALGGDPWSVAATPDGDVDLPGEGGRSPDPATDTGPSGEAGEPQDVWRRHCPIWLALLILFLLLALLILLLVR
jgi:hypothetical protein